MTTDTVTYDAPMRTSRGVKLETVTHPGERYRGWIIDQPPGYYAWRVVCGKSGQVVTTLESLTVARCFVDLLCEGMENGLQIVEHFVRDGVQTYKLVGMDSSLMYALRENAAKAAYQAQVTPGPAEFDPDMTGRQIPTTKVRGLVPESRRKSLRPNSKRAAV